MTAELRLNGVSLVENLPNESGVYKTDAGVVGIKLNIDPYKDRQNVTINCSRRKDLMGKNNKLNRTIMLGSDGRGSQQISPTILLEYDLGRRIRPIRIRRPVIYNSKTYNVVTEIWDR